MRQLAPIFVNSFITALAPIQQLSPISTFFSMVTNGSMTTFLPIFASGCTLANLYSMYCLVSFLIRFGSHFVSHQLGHHFGIHNQGGTHKNLPAHVSNPPADWGYQFQTED